MLLSLFLLGQSVARRAATLNYSKMGMAPWYRLGTTTNPLPDDEVGMEAGSTETKSDDAAHSNPDHNEAEGIPTRLPARTTSTQRRCVPEVFGESLSLLKSFENDIKVKSSGFCFLRMSPLLQGKGWVTPLAETVRSRMYPTKWSLPSTCVYRKASPLMYVECGSRCIQMGALHHRSGRLPSSPKSIQAILLQKKSPSQQFSLRLGSLEKERCRGDMALLLSILLIGRFRYSPI